MQDDKDTKTQQVHNSQFMYFDIDKFCIKFPTQMHRGIMFTYHKYINCRLTKLLTIKGHTNKTDNG